MGPVEKQEAVILSAEDYDTLTQIAVVVSEMASENCYCGDVDDVCVFCVALDYVQKEKERGNLN